MRFPRLLVATLAVVLTAPVVVSAQSRDLLAAMRERARQEMERERYERFIEDTYQFFELSGEVVSYRVQDELTDEDRERLTRQSRELDDQAGRLISYVRDVAPYVRGETDNLWIILEPTTDQTPLEDRLTLILALVNRLQPKFDQLITLVGEVFEPTVPVEELQLETSAPFLLVGGLEELREMTRDLREAL
jgi:hypothetical protein